MSSTGGKKMGVAWGDDDAPWTPGSEPLPGPSSSDSAKNPPRNLSTEPSDSIREGTDAPVPSGGVSTEPGASASGASGSGTSEKKAGAADESVSADVNGLDLSKVTVADEGGTVDKPEVKLRAEKLNEEVEAPETQIMKVTAEATPYTSAKSFEDLNLSEPLLRGLYSEMKFEKPSKIQADTLPMILSPPYTNLIAQAHNGSGKTTCFVLGMLSRVDPALKEPQALCVCPTRELAIQNEEVLLKMAKYTGITCACTAVAESGSYRSTRSERIVDQVVIGTPGTLKRWMTKDKIFRPNSLCILVFDEADQMLDQDGFQDDSMRIMQNIRKATRHCQILLFSATFSEKVRRFAEEQVPRANKVLVPREELSLDVIKQYRVMCPSREAKTEVLRDRIFPLADKLGQSIIFVRTREGARELHRKLEQEGHRCTSIQGAMTHEDRDRVIREFRDGTTKILIATDILARGFDQAQVTLVVNYDIPVRQNNPSEPEYENYLHRIGRSGRFGRKGAAFNLVYGDKDAVMLQKIERHFNRQIKSVKYDDDDAFEDVLKDAGLA
eukprot:TRINITY_DN26761_c0_g1_i1.p1 TRINITY_DN26761_c0_g1~~TRINITY_DN26761_c0_g1_i1.p1  ORF type:complete len:554 (-),score=85.84 TRINITY_DN26761_c0_g1_i1:263-1924(-)